MAKLEIRKEGDIILRLKADEVTVFDGDLHVLLDDMLETMIAADGVGLAAPQVGISKRILIVSTKEDELIELVNPKIMKESGTQLGMEGCLSVDPSKNGCVRRPMKITVRAFDRFGNKIVVKAKEFTARAICHEIDHLNGVLFIDRVEPMEKPAIKP